MLEWIFQLLRIIDERGIRVVKALSLDLSKRVLSRYLVIRVLSIQLTKLSK